MSEYKCKNGDIIRVGGVYVHNTSGEIVAVSRIDCEIYWSVRFIDGVGDEDGYMPDSLKSELSRDEDGYYIWEGGEQPVPDEWIVEVKYSDDPLPNMISNANAYNWSKCGGFSVTAFRVISTGEKATPSWNETVPEIPYRGDGLEFEPDMVNSPVIHIANTPQGYDDLASVLVRALEQASLGKGKDRHAQDKPFSEQPMQRLIDLYGTGFAFGQAGKKMQEARRLEHDAAIREILGAIVYAAGAIISMERGQ